MPSLKRILSAGAPVPGHVIRRMKACSHEKSELFTPYGATESLPIASISGSEILEKTQPQTIQGAGVCVGTKFPGIQWKVIRITDDSIESISDIDELPIGEVGELIVQGPVVTQMYVTRTEWNTLSKITDSPSSPWHRMGDVGYLDQKGRFWYCGRKSHRVCTSSGVMFTEVCEAIYNEHPSVYRTALIGLGHPGEQEPVIVVEPNPGCMPKSPGEISLLFHELSSLGSKNKATANIHKFLLRRNMPVDIRHNAKIFRERLTEWATGKGAGEIVSVPLGRYPKTCDHVSSTKAQRQRKS